MNALFLRFAGPLQSWAGPRITGNHVHTREVPSRSGALGVVAAALGAPQNNWPDWIHEIDLQLRVERPGVVTKDYQTINPRGANQAFAERIWVASGNKGRAPTSFTPDAQKGTSVVIRSYLAGAEFLVAVIHNERLDEIARAFANPSFSPFLGRRAFPPAFPFLLGVGPHSLLDEAPTALLEAERPTEVTRHLAIHVLDGEHDQLPTRSVPAEIRPLRERLSWWSEHATIPERVPAGS